jgi:hypothetical protein
MAKKSFGFCTTPYVAGRLKPVLQLMPFWAKIENPATGGNG